MFISIVVPCYNEEQVIKYTYERIKKTILNFNDYEIIFVNDGSRDNTVKIIKQIAYIDNCVKYISFSRNFGKESAMLAGLKYASGECVIIMDSDLQHPPELIPQMIEFYKFGYDQVIAKRNRIGDSKIRTFLSKLYYKLINKLVDIELIDGVGDFRLLSRKAVNALISMEEYNRFSKGLFSWIGFKQKIIEYENQQRVAGETKWSIKSLLHYGIDGLISFNDRPLRICFGIGITLILLSLIYIFTIFIQIIKNGIDVPGYFTTITAILIIGGMQFILTGILGEYVGRIFYEVKGRPIFIVEESNISINEDKFDEINDEYIGDKLC